MDSLERLELATQAVEKRQVDVTDDYRDWLICAFACASVGESGRAFFHRLSRFSPKYKEREANAQFSACLRSKGGGASLAPLFTLLGRFNVMVRDFQRGRPSAPPPVSSPSPAPSPPALVDTLAQPSPPALVDAPPTITLERWNQLAHDASTLCGVVNDLAPKGLQLPMVCAFIVAASSVCDGIRITYGGKREHVHLYECVIGDAGGGKSHVNKVRHVLNQVHKYKRDKYKAELEDYKRRLADAKKDEKDGLERPPQRLHFVPADISKAALVRLINDIGGGGIIWETEIDTLTSATAGEFGHFGDLLRKNFHSEPVSSYRKGDDVLNEVEDPHLAILLTGTPDQLKKLFQSPENGLFSRFLFFQIKADYTFNNPFASADQTADWSELGQYISQLDAAYSSIHVEARLPNTLVDKHLNYWSNMAKEYATLIGSDSLALIRRLALIHTRASAVISALKTIETGDPNHTTLDITPESWELARALCASGAQTAASLLSTLPVQTSGGTKANLRREILLRSLPPTFTIENFPPDVSRASAYRYVYLWREQGLVIQQNRGGSYVKVQERVT